MLEEKTTPAAVADQTVKDILPEYMVPYTDSRSLGRHAVMGQLRNLAHAMTPDASNEQIDKAHANIDKLIEAEKDRLLKVLTRANHSDKVKALNAMFNTWCHKDSDSGMTMKRMLAKRKQTDTLSPDTDFNFIGSLVKKKPDGTYEFRVSNEKVMNLFQWHNYHLTQAQHELDQQTPELLSEFTSKVISAVNEGRLPNNALDNLDYLEDVKLIFRDPFGEDWDNVAGDAMSMPVQLRRADKPHAHGDQPNTVRQVRLDVNAFYNSTQSVLNHELTHIITGSPDSEGVGPNHRGAYASRLTDTEPYDTATVHEAMTEYATAIIDGRPAAANFHIESLKLVYTSERVIISMLANDGRVQIPPQLFLKAFFDRWQGPSMEELEVALKKAFPDSRTSDIATAIDEMSPDTLLGVNDDMWEWRMSQAAMELLGLGYQPARYSKDYYKKRLKDLYEDLAADGWLDIAGLMELLKVGFIDKDNAINLILEAGDRYEDYEETLDNLSQLGSNGAKLSGQELYDIIAGHNLESLMDYYIFEFRDCNLDGITVDPDKVFAMCMKCEANLSSYSLTQFRNMGISDDIMIGYLKSHLGEIEIDDTIDPDFLARLHPVQ